MLLWGIVFYTLSICALTYSYVFWDSSNSSNGGLFPPVFGPTAPTSKGSMARAPDVGCVLAVLIALVFLEANANMLL